VFIIHHGPLSIAEEPVPELPEVETVVRDLRPHLSGRRVTVVRVGKKALRTPWRRPWSVRLVGRTVAAVRRRGKWIVVDLAGGGHLVLHLGMTGQLRVFKAGAPVEDHTHLVLRLDDGHELRFRDVRRFGSATFLGAPSELGTFFAAAKLGPEPFNLAGAPWRAALAKTGRSLKAVLLDQRVVAGVGNIYADESLFEAKLHPARPARSLSRSESERLRKTVAVVLNRAIELRGTSIRDYLDGNGARGGYQEEFRAYGRTGDPCRRCSTPIARIRLAGRSTHYCPKCQAEPEA
jgi:formamidopyrimidine-DNA glycosylase